MSVGEIQGLPAGVFPVKYFVSTTSDGNRTNDTIRTSFNNAVLPLPALVNFDTCRYMSFSSSGNGYFYNGFPIVQGWENSLTGRGANSFPYGNTFFAMPTNTPTNPTKFHLVSYLFFPNKLGRLRTYSFGPTSSNTWLSYNFNFADYIQPATQMLVGDTISIEASDDCGLSYKVLRSIHRNNFLPYVKVMSDLGAPTSLWRDSVPFPEGSIVHFQIRIRSNQAILNSSEIRFDNLWVKDSITTSISKRPIIQNEMYVYPNPAASEIFVQGPEGEQLSQVFYTDITGRRSRLEMDSENRIGIKALPTGVYLLEAKGKKGMYKKRFVKD